MELKWLSATDMDHIGEIDRSEHIDLMYAVIGGEIIAREADIDSPRWLEEGTGEHSIGEMIGFCRAHLDAGAEAIGVFDSDALVGIGIIRYEVRPQVAQFALLHVSREQRRNGIASLIATEIEEAAIRAGAHKLYVSATPTRSAVSFYRSRGFQLSDDPIPELMDLEPEDIHMVKELI